MRILKPALVALCATLSLAHDDDPKILLQRSPIRPVLSPGWRPSAPIGNPGNNNPAASYEASGVTLLSWLTPGDLGVSTCLLYTSDAADE